MEVGSPEDFDSGVGTYLKVVRLPEPSNPDGFIVLYLRPSGRFLFVGYWSGYERSAAAGTWQGRGSEMHLNGLGQLSTDALPGPGGSRYERVFTLGDTNSTPSLTASQQLADWSLLSWTGPFAYVGQRTVIDPDGRWMPKSLPGVDEWIRAILEAPE